MKLAKAIDSILFSESETGKQIIAYAQQRSKTVNKDVSLAPVLPELCSFLDRLNSTGLNHREMRDFNNLINRFLGALLEQEMDAAGMRWK